MPAPSEPAPSGPPTLEARMAGALLDPARPAPTRDARRFAVHRNNVLAGLVDALAETCPAVRALTGEAFFRAAAAAFARAHPPRSPVLMEWGGAFGGWLDAFPPAASVPYLGDVARLEWARTRAYHAPEALALPLSALGAVAPGALAEKRLRLHPSVRLVASRFPVVALWAETTGRAPRTALDLSRPETALVARPEDEVTVRALAPEAAAFLSAIVAGGRFGAAAEAGAVDPAFDLSAEIAALFAAGLVTALEP
ncbi:MAG: DUF2063 domain-containing protein [Rhodobacteraceae bacterium]|nr:MAG: DUF2063 domain-containing protein [Paracoccaceae bacterium]